MRKRFPNDNSVAREPLAPHLNSLRPSSLLTESLLTMRAEYRSVARNPRHPVPSRPPRAPRYRLLPRIVLRPPAARRLFARWVADPPRRCRPAQRGAEVAVYSLRER